MLYFGEYCLIKLHSSTSASNSLEVTMYSKSQTFSTMR